MARKAGYVLVCRAWAALLCASLMSFLSARAAGDRFEPDNTPGQASLVIVDDPGELHTFEQAGDQDWTYFFALPSRPYSVIITSVSATCDPMLQLYASDGVSTLSAEIDDNTSGQGEVLNVTSLPPGFIYVRCRNFYPQVYGTTVSYGLQVISGVGVEGRAYAISTDTVRVEWRLAPEMREIEFLGYHVLRSTSASPKSLVRVNSTIIPSTATYYDDYPVKGGLSYYYVVQREITTGVLESFAGMFAGLPIPTVDERTIGIRRQTEAESGSFLALVPESECYYLGHRIEFPGYTSATLGTVVNVTIRQARPSERVGGPGQAFPGRSEAVFVVETVSYAGGTTRVAFTDPVNLTVQFAPPGGPIIAGWNDVVTFANTNATTDQMRVVHDSIEGTGIDFQFLGAAQQLDTTTRTITVRNYTALTGATGQATYGVVANPAAGHTRIRYWPLYR